MTTLVRYVLVCGSIAFASCAVVPPSRPTGVEVVGIHSPSVFVEQPRLIEQGAIVTLKGYVHRRHNAATTGHSHLEVLVLDAHGRTLHTERAHFEPQRLPRDVRIPRKRGRYTITIERPPTNAVRIEVRAQDSEPLDQKP